MNHNHDREQGVTAILMVIFFTILMSVITLSFLRIAVLEQTQSLQDQLSKSAYAAAQSGIEDGKRAIIYCQNNPGSAACNHLTDPLCPGFFGDGSGNVLTGGNTLYNKLSLKRTTAPNNAIQVGNSTLNESYPCVVITKDTANVQGTLNPQNLANDHASDFFPLTATGGITKFIVYWGKYDSTSTVPSPSDISGGQNPKATPAQWRSTWPALMRLMILQNNGAGGFDNTSEAPVTGTQTQSYFVYPVSGVLQTTTLDAFGPVAPRQTNVAYCPSGGLKDNGDPKTRWTCAVTVVGINPSSNQYLSLQASYAYTDFAVELYNGASQVLFNNVRPTIDSTGVAGNTIRRVQATVQTGTGNNSLQPVALDALNRICKNFLVTNSASDFSEDCTTNQ